MKFRGRKYVKKISFVAEMAIVKPNVCYRSSPRCQCKVGALKAVYIMDHF